MSLVTNKAIKLVDGQVAFNADIETNEIEFDNYQSAKIVVFSGEGDEVKTTATIVAIVNDEEKDVKSFEITIGGNTITEINAVSGELAKIEGTKIKLKIAKVDESAITGFIIGILGEPRYND